MNQINNKQARLYAGSMISINYSKAREKQYNNLAKINGDMNIQKLLQEQKGLAPKLAFATFKNQPTVQLELREAEIKGEIQTALAAYGLKFADIELCPVCEKCGDTGMTKDGDCECFKKYMFEYITMRLSSGGGEVDFAISKEYAKVHPKLESFYEYAEEFCRRYPEVSKRVFILQGKVGTGKTHLAKGILSQLIAKGASGFFLSAFNMEELFIRHMKNATSFNQSQTIKDEYQSLLNVDVLIIDDIGAEIIHTEKVKPYYINLLETRIAAGRLTIFTTNLTEVAISEKYGERFFSRLTSKATVVMKLETGIDLRKGAAKGD